MTSRREQLADTSAGGPLGRAWVCFLLALAMLVCGSAVPQSVSAAAPSSASGVNHPVLAQASHAQVFAQTSHAPACLRGDRVPFVADEFCVPETETENEDESSDTELAALPLELGWASVDLRAVGIGRAQVFDCSKLLVTTGLGRGPPVG